MHSIVSLFTTYCVFRPGADVARVRARVRPLLGRPALGIHAEVFSIGFGPELLGWTDRNGTRWKISAIPLGGYVKFLGDSDAASATPTTSRCRPSSASGPSLRSRCMPVPRWSSAVPAANLLFAVLLLTGVFYRRGRALFAGHRLQ